MTNREEIRRLMEQEQAEGALRDCIKTYKQNFMKSGMMLYGAYSAYCSCGFTPEQSLYLVGKSIEQSK